VKPVRFAALESLVETATLSRALVKISSVIDELNELQFSVLAVAICR